MVLMQWSGIVNIIFNIPNNALEYKAEVWNIQIRLVWIFKTASEHARHYALMAQSQRAAAVANSPEDEDLCLLCRSPEIIDGP